MNIVEIERKIWYIEKLLSMAWYGAMVPMDSPEYLTGWRLRKIAEEKGLLRLDSGISYDLEKVASTLFNDFHVKDIIYQYLQDKSDVCSLKQN